MPLRRSKQHWQQLVNSASNLDSLSYYQLLGVPSDAREDEISDVYYQLVRVAHPDRHARESDRERKQLMVLLYARLGEAYRVLADPAKRREYDEQLHSGATRLSAKPPKTSLVDTRDPKTQKARQLYEQAQQLLRSGDKRRARATLDLALQFEPESRAIREALDAATPAHLKPTPPPAASPAAPMTPPVATAEATPRQPAPESSDEPAPESSDEPAPEVATARQPDARGIERRSDPRIELAHPVRVRFRNWSEFRTLYTRDISRGGMFLRTASPLLTGAAVQVSLTLPDERQLDLRARVVHVVPPGTHGKPAGMGLRFLDMNDERKAQIEKLLELAEGAEGEAGEARVLRQLLQEVERLRQASAEAVLCVAPDADPEAVRKAYLQLAKQTHPDLYNRYPGERIHQAASEVFYLIRRAYERMRNASKEESA